MAKKELDELRKEVTKQGPKMDYSVVAFPKPTKRKKSKRGFGKK